MNMDEKEIGEKEMKIMVGKNEIELIGEVGEEMEVELKRGGMIVQVIVMKIKIKVIILGVYE